MRKNPTSETEGQKRRPAAPKREAGVRAFVRTLTPRNLGYFLLHAVQEFWHNKGLLLAGAVGYNALISIIPLFAVVLVALSHVFDEQQLLRTITMELRTLTPGRARDIRAALEAFLEAREIIGGIGMLVLLFFSSIAFRILEDAFSVIFRHVKSQRSRPFLVSALIPYLYITAVALGLLALSILTGVLESLEQWSFDLFGRTMALEGVSTALTSVVGLASSVLLLSSIYKVMPVARIAWHRALFGGATAALLWEAVRRVLVWYFGNISLVNVIYGSLATVVIVLLSMEIAAFIVLLGAQIIAQLEINAAEGLPWYADGERYLRRHGLLNQAEEELDPIHDREADAEAGGAQEPGSKKPRPGQV